MGAVRAMAAVAAVALVCGTAWGQVAPSQFGRELDASYQIGGGGLNSPVRLPSRFDSQLYVTGQVSGLRAFRGHVGYRAPDEFGVDLPSSNLEKFRRQSVGLEDVLGGRVHRPAPFYERTTTVFGAREIVAGRTVPGTNIPRPDPVSPSVTRKLYLDATAAYRPLAPPVPSQGVLTAPRTLPKAAWPGEPHGSQFPFGWRVTSGFLRPLEQETERDLAPPGGDEQRIKALVDRRVDASGPREVPPREAAAPIEQQIPAPQTPEPPQRPGESLTPTTTERLLAPNEDVYLDLLLEMRAQQAARLRPDELDDAARARIREQLAEPGARPKNLVGVAEDKRIIIRGLAGTSPDAFNKYMNQAKDSLYNAEFHKAADTFQLAMTINPRNPLARLGRGLAFFGAGEPLSAGINVRKALAMFPPLMETRLDVQLMMAPGTFERRLRELDQRVQKEGRKADPLLLVLGAYLHYSVADVRIASAYAKLLARVAPDHKLYRALATFILTGKRPAEQAQAATQPAQ